MEDNKNNTDQDEIIQIVTFKINLEEYGLEILRVQEIVRLPHITRLPKAPIFIKGVINLRGNIIPILDLRVKFGLEPIKYSDTTRVIVVEIMDKKIGMIVDNVSQVVRVPKKSIAPAPPMVSGISEKYLEGVIRLEDRLIILLNVDDILSNQEVIQIDENKISEKQVSQR